MERCFEMKRDTIHILAASDSRYLAGLYVTLASCIVSNKFEDELALHVIDTGLKEVEKQQLGEYFKRFPNVTLMLHAMDEKLFASRPAAYRGNISTYARLAMGELLSVPKCIYIDVDILVQCNVRELWDVPMGDNIIMARMDDYPFLDGAAPNTLANDCPFAPKEDVEHYRYYNVGVLVCNLDAYRACNVFAQALQLLSSHGHLVMFADQPVLNYICRGRIGEISVRWNTRVLPEPLQECNYHYLSHKKPWNYVRAAPGAKLWRLFNDIFVKEFFPYTPPIRIRLQNIIFHIRSCVAMLMPSVFCFFIKRREGVSLANVKYKCFIYYRKTIFRGGLDSESRKYYETKKCEWQRIRDTQAIK